MRRLSPHRFFVVAVLCQITVTLGLVPAVAAAQAAKAAFLPVGGHRQLDGGVRARAAEAVSKGLSAEGVAVASWDSVQSRLPRELHRCEADPCAGEIAKRLSVDFTVGVSIWADDSHATPRTVGVSLVGQDSLPYAGEADVRGGDVATAARKALVIARAKQEIGPGPWLKVTGKAYGAEVFVDGLRVGVIPFHQRIASGSHLVTVKTPTTVLVQRHIHVPADAQHAELIELGGDGVAETGSTRATPRPSADAGPRRSSERSLLGPAILGGVGAAAVIVGAISLSGPNCDLRGASGVCLRGNESRPAVDVPFIVGGGLAIGGALLWYVLSGTPAKQRAHEVSVGPNAVHYTSHF